MSFFRDSYKRRYETPADILYCPCCAASSDNWETVYFSKKYQSIVGCDACARDDDEYTGPCPVCGAKDKTVYITKAGEEILGCDNCISLLDYRDCEENHREEML